MQHSAKSSHRWRFFRAGGFDQVKLDSGADLAHLDELDQKLWVALACPTTGLEFDPKTLALIDTDKDGRIRAPELIAAAKWLTGLLKNPDDALKGLPSLPLSAINDSQAEGKQLLSSARQILGNLGKKDSLEITLEDTADTEKIFAQTTFNGDGIVPADAASDEATKAAIADIIACMGAETDRSAKPGISQAKADQFFAEAQAYADWWKVAEADPAILPLGTDTLPAAAALITVRAKIDDYFTRCRLAGFDPRAVGPLNRDEKDYLAFSGKDLNASSVEIAGFPLARIEPGRALPLKDGVNPAWAGAIGQFQALVVKPLTGDRVQLTERDWTALIAKLGPHLQWASAKPATSVEKLGLDRLRALLSGDAREKIVALITADKALEPEFSAIIHVEKLVRYHRDLFKLCNNFVSFRDFYRRKDKAIFQAGTLFLDQRSCELCLTVEDPAKHAVMASMAGAYLAYCDCARKGTGQKMQILAAFTDGDSDNLLVGRNGIFYDRKGCDWDATIAKIVDNPISIRQAFWAPYKKVARFVQEQIAKRAAAADAATVAKLTQAAENAGTPAQTAAAAPPPKAKIDPGLIAALSVGAAGVGGMIGGIVSGFLNLKGLMPLGVLAIILIISGPSMILAWLKLRRRNLGPILDANGWAVNAKAKINVPFGASLTRVASLPPGAQKDGAIDPFAEKKRPWKLYWTLIVIAVLALLWYLGKLDGFLPARLKSVGVMGADAPAYHPLTNTVPSRLPLETNAPAAAAK